jgi:hypothetical protein
MSAKTIIWVRPSGTKIETNTDESTIKHCQKLGFKREEEVKAAAEAEKKAAADDAAAKKAADDKAKGNKK